MNAIVKQPWLLTGRKNTGPPGMTLDLNFMSSGNMPAGVSFTRASSATYTDASGVIQTAATNAPRWDYDPQTLQLKGLLLEDASTNVWLNSGDLSNVSTSGGGVGVAAPTRTGNNVIAPDGTMTGTRAVYPAVVSAGQVSSLQQSPIMTAAVYTFSVWLRGNVGGEVLWLSTTPDGVLYYQQQCTLTTAWQRFTLTTGTLTATGWFWLIGTDRRDGTQTSTPAQTIYAWGAQVEALPYMSSHIPTTSVSVTRAADNLTYPIASVPGFTPPGGSWFAEFIRVGPVSATPRIIGALIANSPGLLYLDSTQHLGQYDVAAVVLTTNLATVSDIHKAVSTWAVGQAKVCLDNGSVVASAALTTGYSGLVGNSIGILQGAAPPEKLVGYIRRISYWPRTLSDSEMQAVTTLAGPTLSLDFMTPGTLDPRITFTRASSATYTDASGVVRTAAINAPRWDYAGGVLRGLLIEEQRTNLALRSGDIANAVSWLGVGATAAAGADIAPDGVTLMTRVSENGATSVHLWLQSITVAAATMYTGTFYAKAGQIRYLQVVVTDSGDNGGFATFDLQAGTISQAIALHGTGSIGSASIMACGNGVYRCSVSAAPPAAGGRLGFFLSNSATPGYGPSYTGNAANGLSVWGAQLEQGAFPTSYIPTTSVSVTRAADVAVMPTNVSWFSNAFGSLAVEFMTPNMPAPGTHGGIIRLDDTTDSNLLSILMPGGVGTMYFYTSVGGVQQIGTDTGVTAVGSIVRAATCYGGGPWRAAYKGVSYNAGNGSVTPLPATRLMIGSDFVTTDLWKLNGYIRRVIYWNRALSDTEMQQVTT